jgi:NhaP-type Na+/H+ or K+/H+ antiporter
LQLFSLSGILTVFFCGVLMSHYASYNVTESSRITSRHVFAMLSFIAETFIFLYVGTDALDFTKWKTSSLSFGGTLGVSGVITALVLLGRAAFVFPLSVLTNFMNRHTERNESITFKHQVIIWWAGLMRGAVSIALAFKQFTYSGVTLDPVNAAMVTNTTIVVLFTTLVFGFLTKPLVNYLLPQDASHNTGNRGKRTEPGSPKEDATLPLLSFDESASTNFNRAKDSISLLMEQPVYTIHRYWRKFDDTYMRPIFGGPRRENQPEC